MAKKDINKDGSSKGTTGIDVSNIPNETLKRIDSKVSNMGITRSAYIKNLINQDLRGDKIDNFNKAG